MNKTRTKTKSNIVTNPVKVKRSSFARPPSNKCIKVFMDAAEIKQLLGGRISGVNILKKREINYPLYYYRFINDAHEMSRATTPKYVGKVHTLFKERKFRYLGEWVKWHNSKYPGCVGKAVNKIWDILESAGIDKKCKREYRRYIKKFVENLLYNQTYTGLKIQEVILMKISKIMKQKYKWSDACDDSLGIDGFVGDIPISIKPSSNKVAKKAGTKRVYYDIDTKNNILSFTLSL